MSKFKIGNKVKILSTDTVDGISNHGVEVGMIGEVVGVDEYGADVKHPNKKYNPLVVQQSGNHYKNGEIQPIEYSERNNLSTCQGNIVKYITRHKEKNGVDDLAKIVHYALLEALFVYGEDGATVLRDKVDSLINVENKE